MPGPACCPPGCRQGQKPTAELVSSLKSRGCPYLSCGWRFDAGFERAQNQSGLLRRNGVEVEALGAQEAPPPLHVRLNFNVPVIIIPQGVPPLFGGLPRLQIRLGVDHHVEGWRDPFDALEAGLEKRRERRYSPRFRQIVLERGGMADGTPPRVRRTSASQRDKRLRNPSF